MAQKCILSRLRFRKNPSRVGWCITVSLYQPIKLQQIRLDLLRSGFDQGEAWYNSLHCHSYLLTEIYCQGNAKRAPGSGQRRTLSFLKFGFLELCLYGIRSTNLHLNPGTRLHHSADVFIEHHCMYGVVSGLWYGVSHSRCIRYRLGDLGFPSLHSNIDWFSEEPNCSDHWPILHLNVIICQN